MEVAGHAHPNSQYVFKGTGHYNWELLKIIVTLVTSNGEMLIVNNIVRNGSLWSNIVLGGKSEITHFCAKRVFSSIILSFLKGVFLPLFSRNFEEQSSSSFHRCIILCISWDRPLHQVRRLVFDNHWRCPVPLMGDSRTSSHNVFEIDLTHWPKNNRGTQCSCTIAILTLLCKPPKHWAV